MKLSEWIIERADLPVFSTEDEILDAARVNTERRLSEVVSREISEPNWFYRNLIISLKKDLTLIAGSAGLPGGVVYDIPNPNGFDPLPRTL